MSVKLKGSDILAALKAQEGITVSDGSDVDSIEFTKDGRIYTVAIDTRSAMVYMPTGDCAEIQFRDTANGVVANIVNLITPKQQQQLEEDDDVHNDGDNAFDSNPTSQNYYDDNFMSRDASYDFAGAGPTMPAALSNDIAAARKVFGDDAVTYRLVGSGYWVSAFLPIETISDNAARAWGVDKTTPLEVRFEFDSSNYPGLRIPKIQMFQKEEGASIGKLMPLGQQLGRAVSNYLRRRWTTGTFTPLVLPQTKLSVAVDPEHDKSFTTEVKQRMIENKKALIRSLEMLGFERLAAEEAALRRSEVPDAVAFLFEATSDRPKEPGTIGGNFFANKASEGDADPRKYIVYKPEEGFLTHVCKYILHRVPTASTYCVLCDEPHVFDCAMLRPAVCGRQLCTFAYTDMKIGLDAAESVATDVGVLDLLVNIFISAARSAAAEGTPERAARMLNPYPSVENPDKKGVLALDPAKPDYKSLEAIAKLLPSTEEILGSGSVGGLNTALDKKNTLVFPLFNWIINSNRSYLVKIDPIIPMMETSHQYLLLMSTPEKEGKFKQMKAKHGTKWAFHGSRTNNWHSILRNGLINMSGTSYQLNGAAHGSGVYFAPQAATSFGYSGAGAAGGGQAGGNGRGHEYLDSNRMICLALCEIVQTHINDCGWCWTVKENDAIMTRFFFVYPQGTYGSMAGTATSTDENLLKQVEVVMKRYGMS